MASYSVTAGILVAGCVLGIGYVSISACHAGVPVAMRRRAERTMLMVHAASFVVAMAILATLDYLDG